jgi:hypothetical protein
LLIAAPPIQRDDGSADVSGSRRVQPIGIEPGPPIALGKKTRSCSGIRHDADLRLPCSMAMETENTGKCRE